MVSYNKGRFCLQSYVAVKFFTCRALKQQNTKLGGLGETAREVLTHTRGSQHISQWTLCRLFVSTIHIGQSIKQLTKIFVKYWALIINSFELIIA